MAKRNKDFFQTGEEKEAVRLNKYLSEQGICSRRQADELIEKGEVIVDGVPAVTGMKVNAQSKVLVSGKPLETDRRLVLIVLNKPKGIVCTTDINEPDNVIDFLNYGKRIFPIGRLDKDSEGLLLLTNDGDIVNKILRSSNRHEKEYQVKLNQDITSDFLKGMAAGVPILDTITKPCFVEALGKREFRIILTQGLNRQIRRMCEYFGYQVISLKRIRVMNITLGHLKTGDYRNVTDYELAELRDLLENSDNEPALREKEENKGSNTQKNIMSSEETTKSSKSMKNRQAMTRVGIDKKSITRYKRNPFDRKTTGEGQNVKRLSSGKKSNQRKLVEQISTTVKINNEKQLTKRQEQNMKKSQGIEDGYKIRKKQGDNRRKNPRTDKIPQRSSKGVRTGRPRTDK